MLKRLLITGIVALTLFGAFLTSPASAITVLIKKGSTLSTSTGTPVSTLLTDTATGQTGQTGKVGTAVVTVELPNATSFIAATGTLVDTGNGAYDYFPATTEMANAGVLKVHITCAGCMTYDTSAQVVAFDPNDASLLGLTGVATATAQATNVATLSANQTAILGRLGTPTGASIDADILTRLAASAYTAPLVGSTPPAWYTQTGDAYGLMVSLLNGGHTAFTAPALANAPTGGGGGGSVTVAGYATGQDPATLIKADTALGVALLHHNLGRYTYNATTHVLQAMQDDGATPIGSPITLSVNSSGVITSR